MARKITQEYIIQDKGSAVIGSATKKIKGSLSGIQQGSAKTSSLMVGNFKSMGTAGIATASGIGGAFAGVAAGPLVAIAAGIAAITLAFKGIKASVAIGMEFEKEMANVSTLVDTSKVSIEALSMQIRKLPPTLGSATENAKALYQAISAGVKPTESVAFLAEAAKAAKAGLTDTFTAVDAASTVLNAYSMKAEDVTKINDQMFTAVRLGKTTFGELGKTIGGVATIAAQTGVSTEELLAALATMTTKGIQTSRAVTSLQASLSNVLKVTPTAAKEAERLGIEFNTAALKSKGLAKFLAEIEEKTGGNTDSMSKLFGSVESVKGLLAITGKGAKTFTSTLDEMKNSTGETDKAFKKQTATMSEKMESLKASFEKIALIISDKLLPGIKKAVGAFADFLSKESTMKGIEATINVIATAFKVLGGIIGTVYDVFQILGKYLATVVLVWINLGEVLLGLKTPTQALNDIMIGFKDIWAQILTLVNNVIDRLNIFAGLGDKIAAAYDSVAGSVKKAGEATAEATKNAAKATADATKNAAKATGSGISKVGTKPGEMLYDLLHKEKNPEIIVDIKASGSTIKPISEKLVEIAGKIGSFRDYVNAVVPGVTVKMEDGKGNPITEAIDKASYSFDGLFRGIIQGTLTIQDAFAQMGMNILKEMSNILESQAIKGFKELMFGGKGDSGGGFMKMITGAIGGMGSGGGGGAGSGLGTFATNASSAARGITWHADGGSFGPGELIGVGEKGPEVISTGNKSGSVIPNGGGGGQTTNITIENLNTMDNKSFNEFFAKSGAFEQQYGSNVRKGNRNILSLQRGGR